MPSLKFRIPKNRQGGFIKLLDLDENAFVALLNTLSEAPLMYEPEKLLSKLISSVTIIQEDILTEIFNTLFPLYNLHSESEFSIDDFVEELCKIIEKTPSMNINLDGSNRNRLKERLKSLLSIQTISITSKATSLVIQHEHIFNSVRILTDIRPVFGADPQNAPVAYVIAHMLKIRYFNDQEFKEFFVALDTTDIQNMITVLERAKLKVESLKSSLENANLPYIHASE